MSARVCILTAAYPSPAEPTRAVFLENYVRALGDQGFEITVVSPRVHASDPLVEERHGVMVSRFRYPAFGRRLKELDRPPLAVLAFYFASGIACTLSAVQRQRSDVLYAHWVLPSGLMGAVVAGLTGLPLVVHAHGSDVHRYVWLSRVTRAVGGGVLRCATNVLAVSRDLISTLVADLGLAADRVRLVPMGIDREIFHSDGADVDRREDRVSDGHLELLYVGDLDPRKGILEFARRLTEDADLRSEVRLHIVGAGLEREALEEVAARIPGVITLHGRLEPPDVVRRYRAADVLVLPSHGEGAPLVVMEAIATGLPVLATPVGGIPELLEHGSTGWLEKPEDFVARLRYLKDRPDELAATRTRLKRSSVDELCARRRACQAAPVLEAALGRVPTRGETRLLSVKP